MASKLLLWDIDGTLLGGGHGMRALLRAGQALFGEAFHLQGVDAAGKLDPVIFAEVLRLNALGDAGDVELRARYIEELEQELLRTPERLRCMPGVASALSALRQRALSHGDVVLGLLTGNFSKAAHLKLHAATIEWDWFEVSAFGEDGAKRADLVAAAMQRYGVRFEASCEPRDVIVIGDTPRDVECARAHGCFAFGVATGRFGVAALREAGADRVVEDLSDPSPLFELLPGFVQIPELREKK